MATALNQAIADPAGAAAAPYPNWYSRERLAVLGTGAALPGAPVSSEELIDRFVARFDLRCGDRALAIASRLGIETRHFGRPFDHAIETARPGQTNPDLAAEAVDRALADARLEIGDIGYLIGHTTTPAQPLPSNIAIVADRLGYRGPHLELRQACTGFANALVIAFGLLAMPDARPVAIVGSETGSQFFDPTRADADPGQMVNMVMMGDGAAAIILAPATGDGDTIDAAWFGSIGLGRAPGIEINAAQPREFHHQFESIRQSGADLFDAGAAAALHQGVALDAVDRIIPHQVSGRIGAQCAEHFGLPADHFFVNANRVGNTGSAAIWLALAELRASRPAPGSRTLVLGAEASKYMHGGFAFARG